MCFFDLVVQGVPGLFYEIMLDAIRWGPSLDKRRIAQELTHDCATMYC